MAGDGAMKWICDKEPWLCLLCDDALPSVCGLIKPRPDWMNCDKVCMQLLPVCLSYACCLSTLLCCLMMLSATKIIEPWWQMNEYGSFSGFGLKGKSQSTRRKTCPMSIWPSRSQLDWGKGMSLFVSEFGLLARCNGSYIQRRKQKIASHTYTK